MMLNTGNRGRNRVSETQTTVHLAKIVYKFCINKKQLLCLQKPNKQFLAL